MHVQLKTERDAAIFVNDALHECERNLAVAQARTQEINTRAAQLHVQLEAATAQNIELVKVLTDANAGKTVKG